MTPAPKVDPDRRLQIEQAIARGLSVPQIVAKLGAPAVVVHSVWDAMDAACGEPAIADDAWAEAQSFYTRVCREYRNGAACA